MLSSDQSSNRQLSKKSDNYLSLEPTPFYLQIQVFKVSGDFALLKYTDYIQKHNYYVNRGKNVFYFIRLKSCWPVLENHINEGIKTLKILRH